jgi:hypothetical protein
MAVVVFEKNQNQRTASSKELMRKKINKEPAVILFSPEKIETHGYKLVL